MLVLGGALLAGCHSAADEAPGPIDDAQRTHGFDQTKIQAPGRVIHDLERRQHLADLGVLADHEPRERGADARLLQQDLGQTYSLAGLGLGGVTPLATTLMSEWAAKRVRSVAVAAVIVAVPLGAYLAGPIERMVVPEYGWRAMFLIGAIAPLILFVAFAYALPESPKYMAQRPELHKNLARALNRLLGRKPGFTG